ncbi:MAG TPA: MFS transporter [Pyrinomonadaceae bacterium]|nr:MFS transporter [Pyrinomonadaceae bacterium]
MTTSRLPASVRAFRHRNYQLFFGGQLISVCGTWMQSVAQSWLVYRLTGSAALLGLVNFANLIPVFLLAPLGGATADRRSRHRILLITQIISMVLALALAALTLSGRVQVWHLFVLASLLGINYAFYVPAQSAFVVDMVGKEDLMNAIALNSSMVNGARIIGPAIAGLLVAAIGEGWCFFINGVSYIAVIGGLLLMDITPHLKVSLPGSPFKDVVEGFAFVTRAAPVRELLLLLGGVSLFGAPYAVLMPIFSDQILHHGASALGLLMGASGVGALGAAVALAARKQLRGLGRWVAFATATFGSSLILFSLSRSFWLSAALLIPVGFAMMIVMAASNTLIQAMVPDKLRGRVMAVYSMMFMGMAPIGALVAGSLAQRLGAPRTVILGGSICILSAAVFALRLPRLREEGRKLIIALQMTAASPGDEISEASLPVSPD